MKIICILFVCLFMSSCATLDRFLYNNQQTTLMEYDTYLKTLSCPVCHSDNCDGRGYRNNRDGYACYIFRCSTNHIWMVEVEKKTGTITNMQIVGYQQVF